MDKSDSHYRKYIGAIGENTASRFLMKHGFSILDRNYLRKWGEIDLVAKKGGEYYFIEVKTVSCENVRNLNLSVSGSLGQYRPEDNVHPWKLQRLSRAIESYLSENEVSRETSWQLDLVTVYLDIKNKEAKVERIENIFA